jgi:hypothetical protein
VPRDVARIGRLIVRAREILEAHQEECGDYVLGFAVHPEYLDALGVVELWGLRVFAWDELEAGRIKVLCESDGVLIPEMQTAQELLDSWAFDLRRPPAPEVEPA